MSPQTDIHLRSAFRELEAFAIPGIGTFRKQYQEAAISEHGDVAPPMSLLHFDQHVEDSLLLRDFLYTHFGIAETEAQKTEQEVRIEMLWALETRRRFELSEIGALIRTTEGITIFEPLEGGEDVLGLAFGLQAVQAPAAAASVETPIEAQPTIAATAASPVAASPMAMPATPSGGMSILPWKPLALLLLFGVVFSFVLYTALRNPTTPATGNKQSSLFEASEMAVAQDTVQTKAPAVALEPSTSPEYIASNQSAQAYAQEPATRGMDEGGSNMRMSGTRGISGSNRSYGVVVGDLGMLFEPTAEEQQVLSRSRTAESAALSTRNKSNPTAAATNEAEEGQQRGGKTPAAARKGMTVAVNGGFHVIGGSFSTLDKANEYVESAKAQGINPVILFPANGNASYRVSIFSSDNRMDAAEFARAQKAKGKLSGWILAQ